MRKAKAFTLDISEEALGHRCAPAHVYPLNSDELWMDERSRERLLGAFGQLTIADLIDGTGGGFS